MANFANAMLRPILIVDDNPVDVDILRHGLRRAGIPHPIRSFSGGEEAIVHLTDICTPGSDEGWRPLLCLLDLKMPGFHGVEVLQWIREHVAFAKMAVVSCSSSGDPNDVSAAGRLRAQCYAHKYPTATQPEELVACAERFIGSREEIFAASWNLMRQPPARRDP